MTQVHVADAKDMAGSVAAHAAAHAVEYASEYAGVVTDEVKSLAGDVMHLVREQHESRRPESRHAAAKRSRAARRLTWGVVLVLAAGAVVFAVLRSRRRTLPPMPPTSVIVNPPVTNLGPDAGTPSDVPGPAYEPVGAPS